MVVVAHEDAVAIAVETERNAVAAQQSVEQAEIATSVFGGKELRDQDFAGGIVEKAEQGEFGAALFEPAVQAGVEQKHFAFASAGQTALAVSGSAPFAERADPGGTQQAAKSLATERDAFDLTELLAEMMVVETDVARAGQGEDASAQWLGKTARAGAAAADVCQSRSAALPITRFESFDMSKR